MVNTPPTLVLFDLDGTLAQCYYDNDHSYFNAFKELTGIEEMPKLNLENPHLTDSFYFVKLIRHVHDRDPQKGELEAMLDLFESNLHKNAINNPQHYHEVPGARDFIKLLKDSHHKTGVASGGWERMIAFKLDKIGVLREVDGYKGSDDHHDKADFTKALKNTLDPANKLNTVYFGDSLYDYSRMKALGIPFIGVDFKNVGHFADKNVPVIGHFEDQDSIWDAVSKYYPPVSS